MAENKKELKSLRHNWVTELKEPLDEGEREWKNWIKLNI